MSPKATSSHVVHVIQQSQLRLIVIDSELLDEIIEPLKGTSLKYIICIGESIKIPPSPFEIITFEDLETIGKGHSYEPINLCKFSFLKKKIMCPVFNIFSLLQPQMTWPAFILRRFVITTNGF
jgi:hypothetical protein